MAKISLNDVIFATLTLRGAIKATVRLSGIDTFPQILAKLLACEPGSRGMATVEVRNSSQGWNYRSQVFLSA